MKAERVIIAGRSTTSIPTGAERVEELAAAIEASASPRAATRRAGPIRRSTPLHLLGVALLVGAIVPMDLRLIGVWRGDVRLATVLRLLRPVAAAGAALAVLTGGLLFAVQATDYVALPLFCVKMALVALGLAHALPGAARSPARRAAAAAAGRRAVAGGLGHGARSAAGCSDICSAAGPAAGPASSHCFKTIKVLTCFSAVRCGSRGRRRRARLVHHLARASGAGRPCPSARPRSSRASAPTT